MNMTGYKKHLKGMKDNLKHEESKRDYCKEKIQRLEDSITNCRKKINELHNYVEKPCMGKFSTHKFKVKGKKSKVVKG